MHAHSQRAISPVIGSIVLVALTTVLAAVVAAMAMGMAGGLSAAGPWDADQPETDIQITESGPWVEIEHVGGDPVAADTLEIRTDAETVAWDGDGDVRDGDSMVADLEGSEVRVVWSEHGLEATLAETSL